MKSQAKVVVIGGGIAGCSTLYHLTLEGITDAVLVERDELTSGTTWHSAAQVTNFGPVQTMVGLKSHSIRLYKELAEDPDYPINYHHGDGGIRLAANQEHIDGYNHFISMARGMGVEFELIDAAECEKRHPLLKTQGLIGGLWDPLDGDIDPAQLTQALARRARNAGAKIYRHNPVLELSQKPTGEWIVHTKNGDITCEIVVNASGYRVNEIGAMMGVEHPVVSMEHQYFLTDPIAELEALDYRVPLIRDPIDDFYSRQEKMGLLVGIYEQGCRTWGLDGIDPDFTNALCPNDLDRCLDNMERVFERLPCLTEAGIHTVINGPITYSADGMPLVGQIPGKRNAYCIIGLRAGLGEGGGHGKILAELIAHGESEWDTWCLDPRRFTQYADTKFTALKAIEDYQNEFRFHMPHEHRPAGRPAKTTPLYPVFQGANAAFAVVNGWERVSFFKPSPEFVEDHTFRFANFHKYVAKEIETVQNHAGIMEVSGFNRFVISGEGVREWLDGLTCSKVPINAGKVGLVYLLNDYGNVKAEATLSVIDDRTIWYGSAAAAEYHDMDWLNGHLPGDGSIEIKSLTNSHTALVLAGPKSRDILQKSAPSTDWSKEAFPWLAVQSCEIAGTAAIAISVSFSGELAWELHVSNEHLAFVYETLMTAGVEFGLGQFGLYAAESMRLEKGYRHWKADLITEFNPLESGLERFVRRDKDYLGKTALEEMIAQGPRRKFVSIEIETRDGPAHSGDSVLADGKVIGTITSAGWGHRVGKNLAMAFVKPDHANLGTRFSVQMLGQFYEAKVCSECLYDPDYLLVRS